MTRLEALESMKVQILEMLNYHAKSVSPDRIDALLDLLNDVIIKIEEEKKKK
jgi:ABC-type microcin C transport system duplicated ATPase subunit YejF